jgi:hypothetical protein
MRLERCYKQVTALALGSFIANEVLSRYSIGTGFSIVLFVFLTAYIFIARKAAFYVIFLCCFLLQEFPRDILLDYADFTYNTIKTVKVGPSTLFLYLAIVAFLAGLVRRASLHLLVIFLVLNFVVLCASLTDLLRSGDISISLMATNYKLIIFTFLGAAFGAQYLKAQGEGNAIDVLIKLILICSLAAAVRAYMNLGYEIYNGNIFVFELGTEPLYLFCALLYSVRGPWPAFSYAGFFTTSRAEIIFLVLGFIVTSWGEISKLRPLRIIVTTIAIASFVVVIAQTVPFLIDFFIWKVSEIEIFGGETSGSSLVRRHELLNIACLMAEQPTRLAFGAGLGATYNFDCYPLPSSVLLEEKSFSVDQIYSNVYYGVHTTPSAILLRYGVFGFSLVLFCVAFSVFRILNLGILWRKKIALCLVLIFSFYYFHSQSHAQMIFGFMVSALMMHQNSNGRSADLVPAESRA